jgi:hypothetical protein
MGPTWNRLIFLLLSVMLVAANVDSARRLRPVPHTTRSTILLVNEVLGTLAVVALVVTPWVLGGAHPTREDLTWAILLSLGAGFLSVSALVLSIFDTGRYEASAPAAPPKQPPPARRAPESP